MNIRERNKILEKNLGVIKTVASKFYEKDNISIRYEFDDLFQVGVIGALKGIEKFDSNKYNTKISTQIAFHAKYEIMNYVYRDRCFHEREGNTYTPVIVLSANEKIDDNRYEYVDLYEDENFRWEEVVMNIDFDLLYDFFTPRQREVLALRFGRDLRKVDVAAELGLTKQSITAIEKAISNKIKDKLGNRFKY